MVTVMGGTKLFKLKCLSLFDYVASAKERENGNRPGGQQTRTAIQGQAELGEHGAPERDR